MPVSRTRSRTKRLGGTNATGGALASAPRSDASSTTPLVMLSVPPWGMASRALVARFPRTRSSSFESMRTRCAPGHSSDGASPFTSSVPVLPRRVDSNGDRRCSSAAVSTSIGCDDSLRMYARSFRVRCAPPSHVARIPATSSRRASSAGIPSAMTAAKPETAMSVLLKSCAISAESRPSAVSFSACARSSRRRLSSVTSRRNAWKSRAPRRSTW